MDETNQSIANLARTCKRSGILPIFLGMFVFFVGAVDVNYKDLIVGIFMFIVGYSFYKIGTKIESAL